MSYYDKRTLGGCMKVITPSELNQTIFPCLYIVASPLCLVDTTRFMLQALFGEELQWPNVLSQSQGLIPQDTQFDYNEATVISDHEQLPQPLVLSKTIEKCMETLMRDERMSITIYSSPYVIQDVLAACADVKYPVTLEDISFGIRIAVPEVMLRQILSFLGENEYVTVPALVEGVESCIYRPDQLKQFHDFTTFQTFWDQLYIERPDSFFWMSNIEVIPHFQPDSKFERKVRCMLSLTDQGQLDRVLEPVELT